MGPLRAEQKFHTWKLCLPCLPPPPSPPHSYTSPTLSTSSRPGCKRGRRFLLLIWSWQMQRWPSIKHGERETMGRLMAEKRRPLSVQGPPPLSSRRTGCAQWGEAWETGCWAALCVSYLCVCVCVAGDICFSNCSNMVALFLRVLTKWLQNTALAFCTTFMIVFSSCPHV